MNDTTPCIQNARYIHPFIAPVANTPGRKKKMPLPPARIDRRGPHGMDVFEKLCAGDSDGDGAAAALEPGKLDALRRLQTQARALLTPAAPNACA